MCGIVASMGLRPIKDDVALAALNVLNHRGPDDAGVWRNESGTVMLGHKRLSIIDINTGRQPIVNRQYKISVTVNGELYGYQDIRRDLQGKGYAFSTNSDSEILIFLYLEYGLDFFQYLRGEFAFVLYDENRDLLIAARDRFGIKPLCYYNKNDMLLIASEAKALFELGVPREWDDYSFMHAANMHYQPTNRTLFNNIFQLMPGHFLMRTGNDFSIKKYWDLDYPRESDARWKKSEDDYVEEFSNLFKDSVRMRLRSDVPLCFHLSGGIDSSAVVGAAGAISDMPKHCFSIAFGGRESYDEIEIAQRTADFTNSTLHKIEVSQMDILDNLEDAVYFSEGLAINGHLSCKFLLNKAIKKQGFKVALTGEGADEVLAGYPHLRQDLFNQMPDAERQKHIAQLYATNLAVTGVEIAMGETLSTTAIEDKLKFVPSFLRAKASIGFKMNSILSDAFVREYQNVDFYDEMLRMYDFENQLRDRHIVNQSLYLWTKLTLVNYILNTLGDGCEMSSSIEGRLPFLDHKLFEFLRALPMDMKIKNGIEKHILRQAVKPFVTDEIYRRQKHAFMAPPVTRFQDKKSREFIMDVITSDNCRGIPFFDHMKVKDLIAKIEKMDIVEQTAFEPVIMFLITSAFVKKGFKL